METKKDKEEGVQAAQQVGDDNPTGTAANGLSTDEDGGSGKKRKAEEAQLGTDSTTTTTGGGNDGENKTKTDGSATAPKRALTSSPEKEKGEATSTTTSSPATKPSGFQFSAWKTTTSPFSSFASGGTTSSFGSSFGGGGFSSYKTNVLKGGSQPPGTGFGLGGGGSGFANPFGNPPGDSPFAQATDGQKTGYFKTSTEEEGDEAPEEYEAKYSGPTLKVEGLKDSSYVPTTGEEAETCVLQLRSKLFRLDLINKSTDKEAEVTTREWVEVGIGPTRVLIPKLDAEGKPLESAPKYPRLVMRRESTPHGAGTKLILNQLLVPGKVTPEKHAEKALRLTCIDPETSKPTSFLFKFKTNAESDDMLKQLRSQLENSGKKSDEKDAEPPERTTSTSVGST